MILEFIETLKGNEILDKMKSEGWKIKSQYNPFAFDKGIDYDCYELVLGNQTLLFEWDNWFEWKLTGSELLINDLKHKFSLS